MDTALAQRVGQHSRAAILERAARHQILKLEQERRAFAQTGYQRRHALAEVRRGVGLADRQGGIIAPERVLLGPDVAPAQERRAVVVEVAATYAAPDECIIR